MFNISVLLDVQAYLPETSPFFSAQMALVSTFFQMFIVLGMYNFALKWESRQPDLWSIEITRSCSKLVEILVVICSSSWFVAVSVPIYFLFKSFEFRRQMTKIDFLTFRLFTTDKWLSYQMWTIIDIQWYQSLYF